MMLMLLQKKGVHFRSYRESRIRRIKSISLLAANRVVCDGHGECGVRHGGHDEDSGKRGDNVFVVICYVVLWQLQ